MRSLVAKAAVSNSDLHRIEASYHEALADHKAAKAEVAYLENFVLDEDKLVADQKVKLAQARVRQLEDILSDTVLVAPFDGTVLEILRREGESVTDEGREPVVLFADISRCRVSAEVDERHAHLLKEGMTATIYGKNVGRAPFTGRIELVKQLMGDKTVFSRLSTERKDLDAVQLFISMPPDFQLPVGLRVDVSIDIEIPQPEAGGSLAEVKS